VNKEKREQLGLGSDDDLIKLIQGTNDPEYIKGIIENKKKREQLGLDRDDLTKLIIATRKQLGLGIDDLIKLIQETNGSEYIKGIIVNKEKREQLGLGINDLIKLIQETIGPEYIKKYLELEFEEIKQNIENSYQIINLPNNMTLGMEIESEGLLSKDIKASGLFEDGWKIKGDGSLESGVEVVSPILTGDQEKSSESIKKVCRILYIFRTACI